MAHRHVGVRADLVGHAGQNRRVVFAAAVGADAARAGERAKRQPVLDRAEIAGEVEPGGNRRPPLGSLLEPGATNERGRYRHDERARAAESRGARQVAHDREVGPQIRAGEIVREAARDDRHVVRPPGVPRVLVGRIDFRRVAPPRVNGADTPIRPRRRDDGKSTRHGSDERPAARIVGVFAEDLDPTRHEPRPARRAPRDACERRDRVAHEHRPTFRLARRESGRGQTANDQIRHQRAIGLSGGNQIFND